MPVRRVDAGRPKRHGVLLVTFEVELRQSMKAECVSRRERKLSTRAIPLRSRGPR